MRVNIEVELSEIVEQIGPKTLLSYISVSDVREWMGEQDATELGEWLRAAMSPEALSELKAALE